MKLLIKQRVFSWSDTYDIYDEAGNPKYTVKAEVFSFGHQIHIYTMDSREVGGVFQKMFRFMPQFELAIGGQYAGLIRREISFLRPRYRLECHDWYIEGNVWGWDYTVLSRSGTVMQIEKQLFSWGDTYVLNIRDPRDELLCLLVAIAIDAANCSD